jgi:hypothetical protein
MDFVGSQRQSIGGIVCWMMHDYPTAPPSQGNDPPPTSVGVSGCCMAIWADDDGLNCHPPPPTKRGLVISVLVVVFGFWIYQQWTLPVTLICSNHRP